MWPKPEPPVEGIALSVDGMQVVVSPGSTLLEAVRAAGAQVPTLCYHEALAPIGACRVCLVELEGSRTLVPACQRRAEAGMVVHTDSERVRLARRMVVELLQTSADTDRAPELQAWAAAWKARPERWQGLDGGQPDAAHPPRVDNAFYVRDLDRCILCYRCVKVCGEQVQNSFAISVAGRGSDAFIDAGYDLPLPESACVFCGNCVAVCPTDALAFRVPFDMRQAGASDAREPIEVVTTICPYCGVGCKLQLHVLPAAHRIIKVTAPADDPTTRGFLCVKGRFGWAYVEALPDTVGDEPPTARREN